MKKAARIIVKGIVQGVGFRPFVYRLATSLDIKGFILNSSEGVVIETEGTEEAVDTFLENLSLHAPPLASIDNIEVRFHPSNNLKSFEIKESLQEEGKFIPVSPDIGICQDCLQELFSPTDRRYRYPFINCTNCGPRFTIIQDIPYDREKTTMHKFRMCSDCADEYLHPSDRRYHAQPNACNRCGPKVQLLKGDGTKIEDFGDPIQKAVALLKEGKIIAIKGLGGFHLACSATNSYAVSLLRKRKKREESKPFAIMSFDIEKVRRYCEVNKEEERLLTSPRRPIVLLKKLPDCPISEEVAPRNNYLGVMLPYTPIHYLLFLDSQDLLALVMTSGNSSSEPLTKDNLEAIERLGDIADYLLLHNRDIHIRCDDSVTRVIHKQESMIRRSRGYIPFPIILKFKLGQILATGGELKNTFCLTRDNYAFISQHIGDLKNYEALNYYKESIDHFKRLFRIEPEVIAYDLHPDYLSTKFAIDYVGHNVQRIGIQHHHAHIVSCMVENGVEEQVIGVSLDGAGYGLDGKIWGCEFMISDYGSFKRVGHLRYTPMPGGDMATKEPYRMAISYLYSVFGQDFMDLKLDFNNRWEKKKVVILLKMIDKGINSPKTSSCGRLFDAVSSILGICDKVDYEAQAAVELEMIAADGVNEGYSYEIISVKDILIIDPSSIIKGIIEDMSDKIKLSIISAKFHNTLAGFIEDMCIKCRNRFGIDKVAISGGVFQNLYLIERVIKRLKRSGFTCFRHSHIPPNDGGISLGQAVIANKKNCWNCCQIG